MRVAAWAARRGAACTCLLGAMHVHRSWRYAYAVPGATRTPVLALRVLHVFTTSAVLHVFTTGAVLHVFTTSAVLHVFTTGAVLHVFTTSAVLHVFTTAVRCTDLLRHHVRLLVYALVA